MEHAHAPAGPWREALLLAVALALAVLVPLELYWRAVGHLPTVTDDVELWTVERGRVHGAVPRDRIVLLGTSRIQLAVDPALLDALFPAQRSVMLALDGRSPVATLLDLAADPAFDGVVVCDLGPLDLERRNHGQQAGYVAAFHRGLQLERRLERRLEARLQGRLAVVGADVRLPRVIASLVAEGGLPGPYYAVTYPDRSRSGRFGIIDAAAARAERLRTDGQRYAAVERSPPEDWLALALAVDAAAQRIAARGGEVMFLRMPVDAARAAFDDGRYPSALYWERFATAARSRVIDGRREPGLAQFPTPDGTHIDGADRAPFTIELARILVRERLLPDPGAH